MMTKEVVLDFLKTASYFFRRGVRDSSAQYGDSTEIDAYLESNPLCEPRKFRFIHGEYMSLNPMGGPAFKRMFSNIITSRLPNIEKRRELCKGDLFKYIWSHGYYTNEVYQMCCYEYARGLECGRMIEASTGEAFLESFYDKVSYSDINPVNGKTVPRTKASYNIFLLYAAANDLHVKRRQALSDGQKISSKLEGFAEKMRQVSFTL